MYLNVALSVVGIATGCGLDGLGIESRWGWNFTHSSRPAVGLIQPRIQWVSGHSRGIKRPRRGVDHPPPSSAVIKETAELYFCSRSASSWPVVGWTLYFVPFTLVFGPRIESRWRGDFLYLSREAVVPPSLLYNGYRLSFPGVNWPGRGVYHPPPSSADVKERVGLYLYSVSGPSWPDLGLRHLCLSINIWVYWVVFYL